MPGPGQYNNNDFLTPGKNGKGISFGLRHSLNKPELGPGPGAYNPAHDPKGDHAPSYSIGGRPRDAHGNELPGPGNYNPDISKIKNRAPGVAMGSGPRQTAKAADGPGPGEYNYEPKRAGGISIGGRPKDRAISDVPGPGAYSGDHNKIKDKAPGVNFGSPSKSKGIHDPTPGPGNYDTPGYINPGGKPGGYSFGKDQKHYKSSDTPGPGSYYIPVQVANHPEHALPGVKNDFKVV